MTLKNMLETGFVSRRNIQDWANITGCLPEEVELSDTTYCTLRNVALVLYALATCVLLILLYLIFNPEAGGPYCIASALVFGLGLFATGLVLIARAPTMHQKFARDASELLLAYCAIKPFHWSIRTISKTGVEDAIKKQCRSLSHNQLGREQCKGPPDDFEQYDVLIENLRASINKLHSAASKFWKIESVDHYHKTAFEGRG